MRCFANKSHSSLVFFKNSANALSNVCKFLSKSFTSPCLMRFSILASKFFSSVSFSFCKDSSSFWCNSCCSCCCFRKALSISESKIVLEGEEESLFCSLFAFSSFSFFAICDSTSSSLSKMLKDSLIFGVMPLYTTSKVSFKNPLFCAG